MEIVLSDEERRSLEARMREHPSPRAVCNRYRIILFCRQGLSNRKIAPSAGVHEQTVAKRRKRFLEGRIAALSDGYRSPREQWGGGPMSLIGLLEAMQGKTAKPSGMLTLSVDPPFTYRVAYIVGCYVASSVRAVILAADRAPIEMTSDWILPLARHRGDDDAVRPMHTFGAATSRANE